VSPLFKMSNMKKTTLEEKAAITSGINCGKSYQQIADELHLTKRVVLKWGQKVKKK
jgi:DNA-binding NarL/FixJ family response regulator